MNGLTRPLAPARTTPRGGVAKSLALLCRTGAPEEDGQNVGALIEDAEAFVAQGAA